MNGLNMQPRRLRSGATTHEETAIQSQTLSHIGDELLDLVTESLDDDKAEDIVAIELAGKSTMGDHMVIAAGARPGKCRRWPNIWSPN